MRFIAAALTLSIAHGAPQVMVGLGPATGGAVVAEMPSFSNDLVAESYTGLAKTVVEGPINRTSVLASPLRGVNIGVRLRASRPFILSADGLTLDCRAG